jgi:hypothetical protein
VFSDDGTGDLLVVCLDKYAGFHGIAGHFAWWLYFGGNYKGMGRLLPFSGLGFQRE